MKEKHIFNFIYSILVGGICLGFSEKDISLESTVIAVLTLACLSGVVLLLSLSNRAEWLPILLHAVAIIVSIGFFDKWMFPFAGILVIQIAEKIEENLLYTVLGGVVIVLSAFILWPPMQIILITILSVVPPFFVWQILQRLANCHEMLTKRSEENDLLRERLDNQRRMAQTMEHAARIRERNRLSARIHDEVGHGISGSILLLEGSMISLEKQPLRAKDAISAATENLRTSVDHIRKALREERIEQSEIGLVQIAAKLSRFQAEHPTIKTDLKTDGELDEILPLVWICVHENLTEILTNLLKHSDATTFSVSIAVKNKLVRVQFKDNGKSSDFRPGMGLSVMEERCALCHGRCFVSGGVRGFSIVMTFAQKGGIHNDNFGSC